MATIARISRRRFLQASAAAGGLVLGFHLPAGGRRAMAATATPLNAWLKIASDNSVTIYVAHSEMGQGIYTALPALVAEELEVDWRQVRVAMAPSDPVYKNRMFGVQATGGSTSVRSSFDALRDVGAGAREMLRRAAAERWQVPATECVAAAGQILHRASGRAENYGTLAADAAKVPVPERVDLKQPGQWKFIGKSLKRLDTPMKVDGRAVFGIDVKVPNMLIGAVAACPVFGGTLKAVEDKPALAVPGVRQVVKLPDAVVVLADNYWSAKQGLAALKPAWDVGANAILDSSAIAAKLKAGLEEAGVRVAAEGDVDQALAGAAKRVDAVYEVPFLAHATMEPMNATARVGKERVDIWAPTQAQGPAQQVVAKVMGMKPDQVHVHTTFLGGGFGRKFELDAIMQAVFAAKAAGRPVKVIWSREEDMRHDFYRPAAVCRFDGGIDAAGGLSALRGKIACPSIFARINPARIKDGVDPTSVEGIANLPYRVGARRIDYVMKDTGVPVGFWRSVGSSQNAFFLECFIDELAAAAGKEPLTFRRELLADQPRFRGVLDAAAALAGWDKPLPGGRHRGLALHECFGSIVAEVVEISLLEGRRLRVHKVACVVDCGRAVNPANIRAQMESGIVYGLTAALFGEITIANGGAVQGNFDAYEMLKMSHMPAIEVGILETGDKLGGIGEPGTPPIAPAVVNAIAQATGRRIRSLPLSKHGIVPA